MGPLLRDLDAMTDCQHCGRTHPPGTPTCPTTQESMATPGRLGTRVDRYELQSLLGAGGFGTVYRARHVHTDATVALKLLKRQLTAEPTMIDRFLREAKAATAVDSRHIVKVLDAGQSAEGQAFLAMEFLDGWDLFELASREGPLPAMRLGLLVLQVLEALGHAHAKGIVHRDMKPANVFVLRHRDDSGTEKDLVKLLDFGISKMHGQEGQSGLTMTGVAMGTPSYMAPEQFFDARNVDGRADLYSVSVMLFELLSGQLPFKAESYADLIVKVRTEAPAQLGVVAPQVTAELAQVVMVGLAREPSGRWATAQDFSAALRGALGLRPAGHTPAFVSPGVAAPDGPSPSASTPSMLLGHTAVRTPASGGAPSGAAPFATPGGATPAPGPERLGPAHASGAAPQPPASGPSAVGGAAGPGTAPPAPRPSGGWRDPLPSSPAAGGWSGASAAGAPSPSTGPSSPPAVSGGWAGGRATPALGGPTGAAPETAPRPSVPPGGAPLATGGPAPGWVQPPSAAPLTSQPAPKTSNARWVLIIVGLIVLAGGCCTCAGLAAAMSDPEIQAAMEEAQAP